MRHQHRAALIVPVLVGLILTSLSGYAQSSSEKTMGVGFAWHTMSAPAYGATFQYDWRDLSVSKGNGIEATIPLDVTVEEFETGFFDLAPYAGRTVQLRARVLTAYNGRGASSCVMRRPGTAGTTLENCHAPQDLK